MISPLSTIPFSVLLGHQLIPDPDRGITYYHYLYTTIPLIPCTLVPVPLTIKIFSPLRSVIIFCHHGHHSVPFHSGIRIPSSPQSPLCTQIDEQSFIWPDDDYSGTGTGTQSSRVFTVPPPDLPPVANGLSLTVSCR